MNELFIQAKKFIPGGVNSPVRSFQSVGGEPIFIQRAVGPYLIAESGKKYLDYICAWGCMIAGHANPELAAVIQQVAHEGWNFGAATKAEIELAAKISQLLPSIQKLRLVNSGTEATMTALRLARAYTGRTKIIKFEGGYHGHADALLVAAGSGLLTFGQPSSQGVTLNQVAEVLVLPYNDPSSLRAAFAQYGSELAGVIIEPIAGNMNLIIPDADYLTLLRELCTQHRSVLIFDEVMTGFRVALGGAQSLYQIQPDLTTLGKIIGGGIPIGAVGGKAEIMDLLAPLGPVYQAGTFSGNPLAVKVGLKSLELVAAPNFYAELSAKLGYLMSGLQQVANHYQIPFLTQTVGGMFGIYFTELRKVSNYAEVMTNRKDLFNKFFQLMLEQGIYFAPSAFEAGFISSAHTQEDLDQTITAADLAFQELARLI